MGVGMRRSRNEGGKAEDLDLTLVCAQYKSPSVYPYAHSLVRRVSIVYISGPQHARRSASLMVEAGRRCEGDIAPGGYSDVETQTTGGG